MSNIIKPLLIPKRPVLLLHGLLGFREIGPFIYYQNIINPLKKLGVKVEATVVHPTKSIEDRAHELVSQIKEIQQKYGERKLHLIGHSMGGLDARYLISKLDDSLDISSLATICTPHKGTEIANWAVLNLKQLTKFQQLLDYANIPLDAIYQLQPDYMKDCFNRDIINRPDVIYKSFGACKDSPIYSPLYYFNKMLLEIEGRNDGLVSLTSSRWGEDFSIVEDCDHRDVINWNPWFDALPIYHNILQWQAKSEMGLITKEEQGDIDIDIDKLSKLNGNNNNSDYLYQQHQPRQKQQIEYFLTKNNKTQKGDDNKNNNNNNNNNSNNHGIPSF